MLGLLIIAHAPLASALKSVARHTFPDCAATLEALDVPSDMPVEQIEALARELLARVSGPEALILTDVFGPVAFTETSTATGVVRAYSGWFHAAAPSTDSVSSGAPNTVM